MRLDDLQTTRPVISPGGVALAVGTTAILVALQAVLPRAGMVPSVPIGALRGRGPGGGG
jgi:hypothetical protein